MPIDFIDIRQQVHEWGEQATYREGRIQERRLQAQELLDRYAEQLDYLRRRVERAVQLNPALRCASPYQDPLNARCPLAEHAPAALVLAADGSQINPDRHAAVEYCVINVGAFSLRSGSSGVSGAAFLHPGEHTQSYLLDSNELYTASGQMVTEEIVALRRDLNERKFLAELARQAGSSQAVVTLTDGPLELFRERESKETPEFRQLFQDYLDVLGDLAGLGVVTAGYVDKPRGDLVVRLLELTLLEDLDLKKAGHEHPLQEINDADLFRSRLAPGERSAVFAIQSSSAQHFQDELALHFFYVNVGRPERPWIARVEVPQWVAGDSTMLDTLQAVLIQQARAMGTRPYPYALHRAHEVALVSMEEKEQVEDLIIAELRRRGLPVGEKSYKQSHKELSGRTRYTG